MDKLKTVLKEYGRWSELETYIERIETHIEIDFSHSLENTKALLETVGKEICSRNAVPLGVTPSINSVLKKAFSSMGYANSHLVNQVSSALATIGQQVGELRNEIGLTSHGKSLEEIKQRNSKVDLLTREFLIDTVELVSVFLIRNFETKHLKMTHETLADSMDYLEAEEFNESWDDSFGEFAMGDYSYPASEILFNVDKQAYINEFKAFVEVEA
ncbi:MAG: abortive infection family protein [Pseudomonadales bacterium]|nr:abortive infection family protein [Pseudomonadales bacterium]